MPVYEYKTVSMKFTGGMVTSKGVPEMDDVLNDKGAEGWRLVTTVTAMGGGESKELVLIFIRDKDLPPL